MCRVPSEIAQAKQEATMWRGRLNQFTELPVTEASEIKKTHFYPSNFEQQEHTTNMQSF
jgi:hypothetical protein